MNESTHNWATSFTIAGDIFGRWFFAELGLFFPYYAFISPRIEHLEILPYFIEFFFYFIGLVFAIHWATTERNNKKLSIVTNTKETSTSEQGPTNSFSFFRGGWWIGLSYFLTLFYLMGGFTLLLSFVVASLLVWLLRERFFSLLLARRQWERELALIFVSAFLAMPLFALFYYLRQSL